MNSLISRIAKKIGFAPPPDALRGDLVRRYIKGNGLEVGALHSPLWVPKTAKVAYVDRMPVNELREQYPELANLPLVPVDIVDNGETLKTVADASQDFVVSSHFLEHTQDPIGTLKCHLRVIKPKGVLYLAVPDKRWTFDVKRPETTIEHLLEDHERGPAGSYDAHVREYAELVDGLKGPELEERVRFLKATNYSIHFHVWSTESFRAFLDYLSGPLGLPLKVLKLKVNPNRAENIAMLSKR